MQGWLAVFFLAIVLGLFSTGLQDRLRAALRRRPGAIFLVPAALTVFFAAVLAVAGAPSLPFVALVAVYATIPTLLVWTAARSMGTDSSVHSASLRDRVVSPHAGEGRHWLEFAAIFALWLPLEFTAGKELLPQHAWGVANITARGISITLALSLFLLFRGMKGMKYNLPRSWADARNAAIGFAAVAPVLIALGLQVGYMGAFRGLAVFRAGAFGLLWLKTLLGVALPEELLFRAIIQNWLMQRFGFNYGTLAAAALIFGASHLNNPPGPLPNWRYMLLATIAGLVFGSVFWRSSSVLASAAVHATVNSVRHVFFR